MNSFLPAVYRITVCHVVTEFCMVLCMLAMLCLQPYSACNYTLLATIACMQLNPVVTTMLYSPPTMHSLPQEHMLSSLFPVSYARPRAHTQSHLNSSKGRSDQRLTPGGLYGLRLDQRVQGIGKYGPRHEPRHSAGPGGHTDQMDWAGHVHVRVSPDGSGAGVGDISKHHLLFKGLRVRMGIATGG